MNFRNPNIGIAVGGILLVVGCWIEGWNVGDGAGAVISAVSFLSAIGVTLALDVLDERTHDRRR